MSIEPFRLPSLPLLANVNLFMVELLFAGDQPRGLLLALLPTGGGPLLELPLLLGQLLVLGDELAANRFQRPLLFGRFGVGLGILLSQLGADAAERLSQHRRRRYAGKLRPKLFSRQTDFQRLAMNAFQFAAELLQRRQTLIGMFASLLDRSTLLFDVGHRLAVLGGHLLANGGGLLGELGLIGRQSLAKRLSFVLRAGQSALGFVELLPPRFQGLGGTLQLFLSRRVGRRCAPLLRRLDRGQSSQSPLDFPLLLRQALVASG